MKNLFYMLAVILFLFPFIYMIFSGVLSHFINNKKQNKSCIYPYTVEHRLPNGKLTTNGYAGCHPNKFKHWTCGPNNVYGENIDLMDWEDWRINYYGK